MTDVPGHDGVRPAAMGCCRPRGVLSPRQCLVESSRPGGGSYSRLPAAPASSPPPSAPPPLAAREQKVRQAGHPLLIPPHTGQSGAPGSAPTRASPEHPVPTAVTISPSQCILALHILTRSPVLNPGHWLQPTSRTLPFVHPKGHIYMQIGL